MAIVRSYLDGPLHQICGECGLQGNLSQMAWQRGVLKHTNSRCWDSRLLGDREIEIARILSTPTLEGQPDPILTRPNRVDDDIVF